MNHVWTVEDLISYEEKIANLFNDGKIRAPVHLSHGSEYNLIEIFRTVKDEDWVFCSWRSHYQCLLKGVPEQQLTQAILDGRSIALCFPEKKVFSSAIVGGQIPIAVGVAMSLKMKKNDAKVWCFIGDMTSETGIAQTAIRYSNSNKLPITFVIEDNGTSVLTNTRETWGSSTLRYEELTFPNVISYKYKSKYPHAGAGKRVQF